MPIGTVKFFNAGKRFGFISPDGGAGDVFVPGTSVVAAGISDLKAGQRVSFEEAPEGKGPKAVNLKLLEMPVAPKHVPAQELAAPRENRHASLTLYCDAAAGDCENIMAEFRSGGCDPLVVDYITTPPTRDKLKEISSLLRGTDQSLVRKYDPLFNELRLDDRFISENEFWDAIVEHPALINGPVAATATRAAVCHSRDAVKSFLAPKPENGAGALPKHKTLSPNLLKFMRGEGPVSPAPQKNDAAAVECKAGAAKPAAIPSADKIKDANAEPKLKTMEKSVANIKAKTPLASKAKIVAVKKAKGAPRPKISVKSKAASPVKKPAKGKAPAKAPARKAATKSRRG